MARATLTAFIALAAGLALGSPARAQSDGALARLDFREVIREAKDKVFPAVVFVRCIRESLEEGKKELQQVSGSGVIIAETGEFLTNWHVVDKATEVRCLLYDGRAFDAEVLGTDKDIDLAVGRLVPKEPQAGAPFPYAALGDSNALTEGDFVMAMGAPWGMSRSVSIGIVSCTRRYLSGDSEYSLWIQTDAAISPGNSGGPLVNTKGQVIGINTLGVIFGGDMGFAIPAETIDLVSKQILAHGKVQWSWTGLQLQPLRDFNRDIYFDFDTGVIVAGTDPESPARRAGIQPEDRLLAVNGTPLTATTEEDLPAVHRTLGLLAKQEPATLTLVRGKEELQVQFTPRAKGDVEGAELDCPRWDLTLKAINQFDNPDLYFHKKQGVFVYGVKYPGNASDAGLQGEDIILKVDGQKVETLEDAQAVHAAALAKVEEKPRIVVSILRNGLLRQLVLDFSRDYERE